MLFLFSLSIKIPETVLSGVGSILPVPKNTKLFLKLSFNLSLSKEASFDLIGSSSTLALLSSASVSEIDNLSIAFSTFSSYSYCLEASLY